MESERLTILYIARSTFGIMGEAAIANYARVASNLHDVHVVQTPMPGEVPGPLPANVQLHTLTDHQSLKRRRALFDVLRGVRPDVVHLVQSPHCYDDVMMLKPVAHEAAWCLDFRSPHIGDANAHALARYHDMQFEVDCLLTHSLESLVTNLPDQKRNAQEIPPGVDIAAIQKAASRPERRPRNERLLRFVYVGSLSKTRRLDEMLKMFAEATHVFDGLSLDIYGQGNAEEDLRKLSQDLSKDQQIRFCGRLDQIKLWAQLPHYDAGLAYVPEAMFGTAPSLKSIEYAAVGLPVLASATEGHRAFATRYGFDFDLISNTPDGLTKCLKSSEASAWTQKRIDNNLKAAQALDWERIVEDRLLPIYRQLRSRQST